MAMTPILEGVEAIHSRIDHALGRLKFQGPGKGPRFNTFGQEQSLGDIVSTIIDLVAQNGDEAVSECLKLIDGADLPPEKIVVSESEIRAAKDHISAELEASLILMAQRIESYAKAMMPATQTWFEGDPGRELGVRFTPIENIGAYVPGGLGGSTPLISTVLMNLIPAKVAGVKNIVVATPCSKDGTVHPALLRACELAGATTVYRAGGAQGVAAMALGTKSCPPCSKIIGPGNAFVQEAKRQLFGRIDIDMMAGPSEIGIIADSSAKASVLAADMIAQAEHDKMASSFLFSTSKELLLEVQKELSQQLASLPRGDIALASLENFGALCLCKNLEQACAFSNRYAPEHLELCVDEPDELLPNISHAGAIFMGHACPEVAGDYTAGPSHTLPTCGAARFASGITVFTFLKSSSLLKYNLESLRGDLPSLTAMARAENLEGHARSAESRFLEST